MEAKARANPAERQCRIQLATAADATEWNDFVASHRDGTIYHCYRWASLIREIFGHQSHYWCARDADGRIQGVLPLVRLRSRLFGDYQVSMPYFNYGGVLADSDEIAAALLDHAAVHAAELGVSHVEFRDTRRFDRGWPVREDKVAMELELPNAVDRLWQQLGSKVRAQIKRPLREGAEVSCGGKELLDDFYRVFACNMRDLGTPVYPRRLFAAILDEFPEQAFVIVVRCHRRAVAAAVLLGWKQRLEIPWASSLRDYNRLGVNMLLYWEALRQAIGRGYGRFDFGRSSVDSGTYRFKRQWGAKPIPLYWHYWLPKGGRLPNLTPTNAKYRLAIRCWQRLPVALTRLLGPHLVKNLP